MSKLCKDCTDCCCTHDNGGTFITLPEALKIAKGLNQNVNDICEYIEDKDLENEEDFIGYFNMYIQYNQKILPFSYKKNLLILKKKGRNCIFLKENGCSIKELRPAYCHIYPFWFKVEEDNIILFPMSATTKEKEPCLIRKEYFHEKKFDNMLNEINETKESMLKIISQFIEEIKSYQNHVPFLYEGMHPSEVIKKFKIEKSL